MTEDNNHLEMTEDNNLEIVATDEEEEDDDDDDDGPPPGFQCIITPQPPQPETTEADDDEEDEDGPPPGFHSVAPKLPPPLPSSDMGRDIKQENIEDDDDEDDDDDDGPPPGWEFTNLVNALPKPQSKTTDIKTENDEELDEGPPPGWGTVLSHQMPPPCTPPLRPCSTISSNIEMESKQKFTKNDDEVSPQVSQCIPMPGHSSPATTSPLKQMPSSELPCDTGSKEEDKRTRDKRPTSNASPLQQLPPTPRPLTPALKQSSSGKAQLVCGTCRNLCLYPAGAKLVQCPGCQEVNFVLEAHEIGQVKCGGCEVLLMYPHGSPAVQCSSCRFVTEIGVDNRRPPLSVQQDQARAQARRRRRFNRTR